jgi:hypothetical protein
MLPASSKNLAFNIKIARNNAYDKHHPSTPPQKPHRTALFISGNRFVLLAELRKIWCCRTEHAKGRERDGFG